MLRRVNSDRRKLLDMLAHFVGIAAGETAVEHA